MNSTLCPLLCLVPFTQHNAFETRLCWSVYQFLFLFIISHCMDGSQFVPSPVDRHLVCCQCLAIMNKVAEYSHTSLCVDMCFHLSWVNTQEWNRQVFGWAYVELCQKLPDCFPSAVGMSLPSLTSTWYCLSFWWRPFRWVCSQISLGFSFAFPDG